MSAPLPPSDLLGRAPLLLDLAAGSIVHRFHSAAHDPLYFDRGREGRLNASDGSYGVIYTADSVQGAFAETFLREPGRSLLPIDLVEAKAYAMLEVTRPLTLVRLSGPGLARLGATAEVLHGGLPYEVPQAWSKAIHDLASKPDGIAYRARHDDDALCYALFEAPSAPLRVQDKIRKLDADWFWTIAITYGVGLAPP